MNTGLTLLGGVIDLGQYCAPFFFLSLLSLHFLLEFELLILFLNLATQDSISSYLPHEFILLHLQLVLSAIVLQLGLNNHRRYTDLTQCTTRNDLHDNYNKQYYVAFVTAWNRTSIICEFFHMFVRIHFLNIGF